MRPHADELLPFMPKEVRDEYVMHDPEVEGFTPLVKHWITTSTNPFVEKWVERLKIWSALQYEAALKEQEKMSEIARQLYAKAKEGAGIRQSAVLHPVVKRRMELHHGRTIWHDPDALTDTKKQAPKIFIQ